ncbi:hypothetical protein [Sphingobium sp. KCTC 72723]|uniref:hypothetical protein n=1 Tax=Sphingobium sp. KCTC 72723 TaxID=2733867 RepID=UPI00165E70FC|nr:hypothetical protein [Sphingobium sp. KCTC 72723]
MSKHSCTNTVTHSKVKVEQLGRKAVFLNPDNQTFDVHEVDGCLITDGLRSDYIVSKKGVASVIVELKGKGVEHACNQLLETVKHEAIIPLLESKVGFLVVCRRFPRHDTYVRRAQSAIMKKFKTGFHIVCDQRELTVEGVIDPQGPY